MIRHAGFLSSGNDLHAMLCSLVQAQEWCASHPECRGFTFAGADPQPGVAVHCFFKSIDTVIAGAVGGWKRLAFDDPI
jgi:hypothetical protein